MNDDIAGVVPLISRNEGARGFASQVAILRTVPKDSHVSDLLIVLVANRTHVIIEGRIPSKTEKGVISLSFATAQYRCEILVHKQGWKYHRSRTGAMLLTGGCKMEAVRRQQVK